ncbi:MAG TPA: Smr/MutS family protein [Terriglobia bacterium]|nr:Smr/MutS family protein [Terriglobia bacterium]
MRKRRINLPKSDLVPGEDELFEREMSAVRRIHHNQAPIQRQSGAGPLPQRSEGTEVERGEVLQFLRPGIQTAILQKLRRGQFPVEATLDLHGFTKDEASRQLQRFLLQSLAVGRRSVRIVHGKGQGSPGQPPILKSKINQWLRENPSVWHSVLPGLAMEVPARSTFFFGSETKFRSGLSPLHAGSPIAARTSHFPGGAI